MASNNEKDSARFHIENPFYRALDAMGDGIWDWDLQTGEMFCSDRWLESLGYDRNDVSPGVSFAERVIHPEDRDVLSEISDAHLEGQTDYFECEYRMRKKSGDYRWTLSRGRVLERDSKGKALRVLGVNFDITSNKAAELFLEQVEHRCSTIVETAGCVILCLDTNLRILEWNRAAEKISGWTEAEVRGKNYVEWFVPEEVRGRVTDEIQRVLAGGDGENYENPIITRDGTERLLLWNSKCLVNSEGKTWGAVGIAQDITEQKRAERQRELAYQEMEVMLERFEALRGLVRVCSVCKKVRDHEGNWSDLDEYLHSSMDVEMSHGYCPMCFEKAMRGEPS